MIDKTADIVNEIFKKHIKAYAKKMKDKTDDNGELKTKIDYGLFIIFYSGHGRIIDGKTMGIDQNGADIDLEGLVT